MLSEIEIRKKNASWFAVSSGQTPMNVKLNIVQIFILMKSGILHTFNWNIFLIQAGCYLE